MGAGKRFDLLRGAGQDPEPRTQNPYNKRTDASLEPGKTVVGLPGAACEAGGAAGGVHRGDHGQVQSVLPDVPARDAQAAQAGNVRRGEPFMDPRIFERIEFCHRHSISTLLSTNGTFLDERIADRVLESPLEQITLSFDGASKESFEFYRKGAKFEKVRDNFVRFAEKKHARGSKLQVVVQMVRMERNAGEVEEFVRFWRGVPGVDQVRIKED